MGTERDPTKEEIFDWLTKNRRDRQWLAKLCGVTYAAVSNWYSPALKRPIPPDKMEVIKQAMKRDKRLGSARPEWWVEMPQEWRDRIEQAALKSGMTTTEFCQAAVEFAVLHARDRLDHELSKIQRRKQP